MTIRPVSARWFELLTTQEDLTVATEALARTGTIEIETFANERARISLHNLQQALNEFDRLARRYQPYWPRPEIRPIRPAASPDTVLQETLQTLGMWELRAKPLINYLETLLGERSDLRLMEGVLERIDMAQLDLALLAGAGPVLSSRVFAVAKDADIDLTRYRILHRWVTTNAYRLLLATGAPDDLDAVASEVVAQKGHSLRLPVWLRGTPARALEQVRQRLHDLDSQIHKAREKIDALAATYHLNTVLGETQRLDWFLTHFTTLSVSDNFTWVTGWTSDLDGEILSAALDQAGVRGIVHYPRPPDGALAPMLMQNPRWARPFELFARMLGTPSGTEADPSRFLAVLVPLLFGYMFGDVGHGLVLAALGIALQRRWPMLRILVANGFAAALFGVVFGSVFGRENVIPALWVHPLSAPLPILLVPLVAGACILLFGLLLNAMEWRWRGESRRWWQTEAAILVLYLSIITSTVVPSMGWITLVAGLWFLGGSVLSVADKRLATLVAAAGTLVEKILQLLINTLSFVRVGAFALAHSGLALAFNMMAQASDNPALGYLILVTGNIVVLTLEGLVVTIQTTRLVLFEFFVRFLRGEGRIFHPLVAPVLKPV